MQRRGMVEGELSSNKLGSSDLKTRACPLVTILEERSTPMTTLGFAITCAIVETAFQSSFFAVSAQDIRRGVSNIGLRKASNEGWVYFGHCIFEQIGGHAFVITCDQSIVLVQ